MDWLKIILAFGAALLTVGLLCDLAGMALMAAGHPGMVRGVLDWQYVFALYPTVVASLLAVVLGLPLLWLGRRLGVLPTWWWPVAGGLLMGLVAWALLRNVTAFAFDPASVEVLAPLPFLAVCLVLGGFGGLTFAWVLRREGPLLPLAVAVVIWAILSALAAVLYADESSPLHVPLPRPWTFALVFYFGALAGLGLFVLLALLARRWIIASLVACSLPLLALVAHWHTENPARHWNDPFSRHVYNFEMGGARYSIPRNYIQDASLSGHPVFGDGVVDEIVLLVLPSLEPFTRDNLDAWRTTVGNARPYSNPRHNITIELSMEGDIPAEDFAKSQKNGRLKTRPDLFGFETYLARNRFYYHIEIEPSAANRAVLRCWPTTRRPENRTCDTAFRLANGIRLSYRFSGKELETWRSLDTGLRRLVERFTAPGSPS